MNSKNTAEKDFEAETIDSLVKKCKDFLSQTRNSTAILSPNLFELANAFLLNQSEYGFLECSSQFLYKINNLCYKQKSI